MNCNQVTYRKLGDFITQRREKNKGFDVPIRGVSREGFIDPKQQDADTSIYNVFYKNDFVFNPARMELNSIALNTELEKGICSSLYEIFYINDVNVLDPVYLNMLLKHEHFIRFCAFKGWGSVREYFRVNEICEYVIPVIPIEEQRLIIDRLQAVQKRIDVNKQTITKLEDAAQAIYRNMFVEGIDPEKLPKGWKMGCLGNVTNCYDSRRKPVAGYERVGKKGIYPYYGATSIMDYVDEYIFDGEYILMGEDGSVIDNEGKPYLQYIRGKSWINNHAHVLEGKGLFNNNLLYWTLRNTVIKNYITGAVQLKLNQQNMNSIPVIIPNDDTLIEAQKKINPITDYLYQIQKENDKLINLLNLLTTNIS